MNPFRDESGALDGLGLVFILVMIFCLFGISLSIAFS